MEQNIFENHKIKMESDHVCRECGVKLTDENWYASNKKTHNYICKKCNYERDKKWQQNNREVYNQIVKKWRQNNRDKYNQSQRELNHQLRDEAIDAYGGKCKCCGETRREFLTIDHIDGNGRKHRREIGVRGSDFYGWLKQNNYPKGFQVLCFNCNCGKGTYSVSPHDKEDFEKEFEAKLKESRQARYGWNLRMDVIKGYGGKCELCGKDNPHYLTIDHIDGEGAKERKILGGTYSLYIKLRDENYPKDEYRLLCYNCNCALGFNRITEEDIIKGKDSPVSLEISE